MQEMYPRLLHSYLSFMYSMYTNISVADQRIVKDVKIPESFDFMKPLQCHLLIATLPVRARLLLAG